MLADIARNYAAPVHWRFLDGNARADLQGFLASGVLGGLLTGGSNRLAGSVRDRRTARKQR